MAGESTLTQMPQLKEDYGGRRRSMAMKGNWNSGATALAGPGVVDRQARSIAKKGPKTKLAQRLRDMARGRIGKTPAIDTQKDSAGAPDFYGR
jgi:hypothetical protein